MKIILNADLEAIVPHENTVKTREQRRANGHKEFAKRFISDTRDVAKLSKPEDRWSEPLASVVRGVGDHERTQTGFANVVADAYSAHLGLVIHPHDIWFVILSNIAAIAGDKPDIYKPIYTVSDKKELLLVEQDDPTDINIEKLVAKLAAAMPTNIKMFLPELSTATPQANIAMAAAVLDAGKNYYDYGMFCCGIPFIDLRGTVQDWNTLDWCVNDIRAQIQQKLPHPPAASKLTSYLCDAQRVIAEIRNSFTEDQTVFWKDIFTKENVGSGGDLKITGWICDLYHNVKRGGIFRSFHDTVASFTYENVSTKEHFMQFHGAFGSNVVDGAIEIAYDHVTIQYTPKE